MSHHPSIAWQTVLDRFQQIWGYAEFRPPQGEIVQTLLDRQDALVVMPTGGGKSICFQLPALLSRGLTIVVSPLVALMENQVQELRERQLPSALLHGELSGLERKQTLRAIEQQTLRLLYLSPETLLSPPVWERLCLPQVVINGLILDEAHCLTQWGDSFRPAYRRLGAVRSALLNTKPAGTKIPIAAFTATADPSAQQTLRQVLGLQQERSFLLNPYRSNLHLSVRAVWTPRGRRQQLLRFLHQHPQQAGLIYVRTRRDSEMLAADLRQRGYTTAAYHAGLSPESRRSIEADWLSDAIPFVICTNAFGMGINKPNVRWVLHFQAPMLLSEYVQEVGRAGRDGKPAEALTLISERSGWFNPDDRQRQQFFQGQMQKQRQAAQKLISQIPKQGEVTAVARRFRDGELALALLHSSGQLEWHDPFHYLIRQQGRSVAQFTVNDMQRYLHTRSCRWQTLLRSFGFSQAAAGMRCGHCDRCGKIK